MQMTRREAIRLTAAGASAAQLVHGQAAPSIAPGPFQGTRESLHTYRVPEWFRDAKFGIWAHWGPQSAPEYGDWYARNMYIQGHRQYKYHVQNYGHPSKFGFKDIIPTWKAEKFDPDGLMVALQEGGREVLRQHGRAPRQLRPVELQAQQLECGEDGPEEGHRGALPQGGAQSTGCASASASTWPSATTGSRPATAPTRNGPFKGVPYDGADPKYASLYHETHDAPKSAWEQAGVPLKWKAALLPAHQGPDRPVRARPAVHRRADLLRGVGTGR